MLSNHEVADVFAAIADTLEILGEDRFRVQAYRRGAEAVIDLPEPLSRYRDRHALEAIPGIGKTFAEKITELLDTGELELYMRLAKQVPPGVRELLRVPNLGPRTAGRLYSELGVAGLADLKRAATDGRLRGIKGFGDKTVAAILVSIAAIEARGDRTLRYDALRSALALCVGLRAQGVGTIDIAGELRRGYPTVDELRLLATTDAADQTLDAFCALPAIAQIATRDATAVTVILQNGQRATLATATPGQRGALLLWHTGDAAHLAELTARAAPLGIQLSVTGLVNSAGKPLDCPDERTLYTRLDLPFIDAELRDQPDVLARATRGALPTLIVASELRADLHMHSTWSDGTASIAAMAAAAQARGYGHMAITDHGAYLGVTNGLDAARLRAQAAEVADLNAAFAAQGSNFRILHGVEVDILADGALALADDVLAQLDIVIAAPHVSLRQNAAEATARIVRAIRNPHVDIIGHPTGRLIGRREGLPIDIDTIAAEAAARGTLLEVNCGPDRLDLDAELIRRALTHGAQFTIDSDAHHPDNLEWITLGIDTARRGGVSAALVANTWECAALLQHVGAREEQQ